MRDGQCSSGNRSDELVESGSRFLGSSLVLLSPYVRDLNSNGMEMSGKAADSCERLRTLGKTPSNKIFATSFADVVAINICKKMRLKLGR